ncbi:MAG: retropepsin-like aspartic protease [Flavobacteriaceae bacterium]|nr:retropepsin-like aspartic protease [Flavobacteriaceae bacterium]
MRKGKSKLRYTTTKHLLTKGQINNKKGIFLIDTGASICCVNQEKMKYFGIQSFGQSIQALMVNGQNVSATPTSRCELKLGRFKLGKHHMVLIDMRIINQELTKNKCESIDAIIGGELLKQIGAQIDYNTMTLQFNYRPKA